MEKTLQWKWLYDDEAVEELKDEVLEETTIVDENEEVQSAIPSAPLKANPLAKRVYRTEGGEIYELFQLIITRGVQSNNQTLGLIQVVHGCKVLHSAVTLELPYIANKKHISCIPLGDYVGTKYDSPNNEECILINDVPNRDMIEIHAGNFYTDIEGCILVGRYFSDINHDDIIDVTASRQTLDEILSILPNKFLITIK